MTIPKWIGPLVLDCLSLFLVLLPWIVLQTSVKPYHRGFFCDDDSIKYPFIGNTVTSTALFVSGFIVSFLVFAVTEAIHFAVTLKSVNPPVPYRLTANCSVPRYFFKVYKIYGIFLFGLAIQETITNIGKYSVGRLRPHFLSVCKPNFATLNCTLGDPADGIYAYIDGNVCSVEEGSRELKDARLSFPSGHSSFATYVAVFLTLYLQVRMSWKGSRLLKHCLQVVLIYLAIFVCLSRVSDYKHHWSDVLGGAVIGVFVAALTAIHVSNQFKNYRKRDLSSLEYNDSLVINSSEATVT